MKTETKVIIIGVILTVLLVVGAVFLLSRGGDVSVPEDQIISRQGLHWHPKLTITIKGKKEEIPANLGIGAVHQEMHTHDQDAKDGIIHMEIQGIVSKEDTRLGNFFRVWGKEFNSTAILDKKNGSEGSVKMSVNGNENKEFENYQMKDGDNIEIRYE